MDDINEKKINKQFSSLPGNPFKKNANNDFLYEPPLTTEDDPIKSSIILGLKSKESNANDDSSSNINRNDFIKKRPLSFAQSNPLIKKTEQKFNYHSQSKSINYSVKMKKKSLNKSAEKYDGVNHYEHSIQEEQHLIDHKDILLEKEKLNSLIINNQKIDIAPKIKSWIGNVPPKHGDEVDEDENEIEIKEESGNNHEEEKYYLNDNENNYNNI